MFDIGLSEILIVAIVALVVLGPERLPKAARLAGFWVRKARAQWYTVKAELESEMADEELKRSLKESMGDLQQTLDAHRDSLQQDMRALDVDLQQTLNEENESLQQELKALDAEVSRVKPEAAEQEASAIPDKENTRLP
ncbi:MAG: Sec-independent protein translocase protein TatB [Arenimonas sp.]